MKRKTQILFLLCAFFISCQQIKYAGEYSFGTSPEEGRTGGVYIYPDTDSTLLFYLELSRGAPSYNSGAISGQLMITSPGQASITRIDTENLLNCGLIFIFEKQKLTISTVDGHKDCGFGYAVYADGKYEKKSDSIPLYFIDRTGEKTFFKDLDWNE